MKIWRVSIWKGDALDAGHSWDTARVNTDAREPDASERKPGDGEAPKEPEGPGK